MNSGPARRGALPAEDIIRVVDEIKNSSQLNTIIFAGGEPTLLKQKLLASVDYASRQGLNTRLVTNASWAVSETAALEKLTQLRNAGLRELNISADDFHLPFIPFARVKNAWAASKQVGFDSVIIANCSGPDSVVTPEWIMEQLGENLPLRFGNKDDRGATVGGTYYGLSNARLQRLRSKQFDIIGQVHSEQNQNVLNQPCPFAGRSVALAPDGHLLACCGFEFETGNPLRFQSINSKSSDLIMREAYDSVLLNVIASIGPYFLMQFVKRKAPEIAFRDDYGAICEICYDVTARSEVLNVLRQYSREIVSLLFHFLARGERPVSQPDLQPLAATA
jgi:hypothetical protein